MPGPFPPQINLNLNWWPGDELSFTVYRDNEDGERRHRPGAALGSGTVVGWQGQPRHDAHAGDVNQAVAAGPMELAANLRADVQPEVGLLEDRQCQVLPENTEGRRQEPQRDAAEERMKGTRWPRWQASRPRASAM